MVSLKIVQAGDPVLRILARELAPKEIKGAQIRQLIELMRETMREAPGVGLAAPQIGLPLQLAVIEDPAEMSDEARKTRERYQVPFHVIINPVLELGEEVVEHYEGCLSVEGFMGLVPRTRTAKVRALNEKGEAVTIEASGWYARILQHEIDHLHGGLYIDRMHTRTFTGNDAMDRFGVLPDDLVARALPASEIEEE